MKGITLAGKIKKKKRRIRRLLGLLVPIGAAMVLLFVQGQMSEHGKNGPPMRFETVFQSMNDPAPNKDVFSSNAELYMGIDHAGNLTLFDGPPKREKPIETFFQLDIEYLETSLPHETVGQLYEGIRIRDKEEYNSVLSSMSTFISEEATLEASSNSES